MLSTVVLCSIFSMPHHVSAATYYVDSASGLDSNNGTSISTPWQTITKVNSSSFQPGDNILFLRGDTWQDSNSGTLVPASGTSGAYVTYGAYGTGAKPILTTAYDRSNTSEWADQGNNIWLDGGISTTGSTELLSNPSFDTDTSGWTASHCNTGCSDTLSRTTTAGEYDSAPGGGKILITNGGTTEYNAQLLSNTFSITSGKTYLLTFRAKASATATTRIYIQHSGAPFTAYSPETGENLTTSWVSYSVPITVTGTDSGDILIFNLGHGNVPDGTTIYIDTLSLKQVTSNNSVTPDVASIIMNSQSVFGTKTFQGGVHLTAQGNFWYDLTNHVVEMYSVGNPATFYNNITLVAQAKTVQLGNTSYVIFDGLHFSMTNYGIQGSGSNNLIIRNCDFSYIGGGNLTMDDTSPTRSGNGIEFYNSGHDITVVNNRLWEVYDSDITSQGSVVTSMYNLNIYNNIMWDSEQGLEFWAQPSSVTEDNIHWENNTAFDMGDGWSHNQRPSDGPNGRGYLMYTTPATLTNTTLEDNLFSQATESTVYYQTLASGADLAADYNFYITGASPFLYLYNTHVTYPLNQFSQWQSDSGKDQHSITLMSNNSFNNPSSNDYSLTYDSPAIDAGTNSNTGRTTDILSNPIYGAPDIGAYEYQPPHNMATSDTIDIGAGARIYGDGKFRDLGTDNTTPAHLFITPQGGIFPTYGATNARPAWLDVTNISNWTNTHKTWTESNAESPTMVTDHTVGDLNPNANYTITVTGATAANISGISGTTCVNAVCKSNSSGVIAFEYSGGYSTHTFDMQQDTYTVGGTISGLSGTIVLQNNAGDNLSLSSNGSFAFATPLNDGSTYAATILTQPAHQTCTISNGSGTLLGANITAISVSCPIGSTAIVIYHGGHPPLPSLPVPTVLAEAQSVIMCTPGELFNSVTGVPCLITAASVSSLTSPTTASNASLFIFTINLHLGSSGPEVKLLQHYLNSHSFSVTKKGAGSETSYFGFYTKAALTKYQKAHDLTPDGRFGPLTRASVNSN